ncbi:hypothetical protein GPECTOR_7g1223 [Gonium pectorale]|uniref:protein-tyrosine-phosphatase n=1 Tax=Gonium pectorale TaxID=33097 RepID=A0A150GU16_GONPE|nr:hypothetical protein GPECTOR_7g1223 [Gonium pectorale]|eukprot:KXZ53329.1 hypothetical protein GPECTOR_7g1223 [Gonium pectorale]
MPSPSLGIRLPLSESVERVVVNPVIRAAPWDPNRLEQQEQDPKAHVLLVSESDVCRSVLAAACLRRALQDAGLGDAVEVATCGTRPYNLGEGPEPAAVAAAEALGLELPPGHCARLFEPARDIVAFDLLLTMDKFTAGDVMREVSSFDLINRSMPFSYKVRRLSEFLGGAEARGLAAAYGNDGPDALDIEDPLYGNVGGEEEQRAVLQSARTIRAACNGLAAFLRGVQDEEPPGAAVAEGGSPGDAPECELPLPGQAPVCSGASVSTTDTDGDDEEAHTAGRVHEGRPLGPALRARVLTMGPTPWLVPPMLSPRPQAPAH